MTSTFACCGSVKSRNFVPVSVWKHCRRKFSVSRTSIPEGGSGREEGVEVMDVFVAWERGWRRVVKAWTLRKGGISRMLVFGVEKGGIPVKCPCQDEVVIDAQLVQTLSKVSLENKPAGLVDYD
jgi:hypothetical protein